MARFQISFQGRVSIRYSNGSIPTAPTNSLLISYQFAGHVHVTDLVGFFPETPHIPETLNGLLSN